MPPVRREVEQVAGLENQLDLSVLRTARQGKASARQGAVLATKPDAHTGYDVDK